MNYLLLDASGAILEANVLAARLLGKERRILKALPLRNFILEADREEFDRQLDRCRCKGEKFSAELRLHLPGEPLVELVIAPCSPSQSEEVLLQVVIHEYQTNGSHRGPGTVKEAEIQRLSRTIKALSKSSQAMMRASDEAGFMNEVCKIVQEDCGHAMVWIGFARDDDRKSIQPVAYAGFEEGYLETLRLTWTDSERGRGPTGSAVRAGKPYLCRNMLTDPRFAPWREEAIRRGYAASIALPLMSGSKAFGAITIYSRETDPFSEDEVKLLSELADDLSYGLTALRLRAAREVAEQSLQDSEQRHRALFENMSEGFALHEIITDSRGLPCDYRFLEVNPAFEKLTGLRREVLLGRSVLEILPETESVWIERYGKVALTGEPVHFENYSAALGRWYEVFAYRPATLQFAVIFTDITERKLAEDERREVEERVRRKLQSVLEPEGDLGVLELSDLLDVAAMQKLMDSFYAVSRFPMSIADMKGKILVGVGWQDICTRFHRVHPETCRRCLESDTQLSAGVPGGEFRLYRCKNGLWDIATPIIAGGRQVGNILSGQFFFDDEEIDREFFRGQAHQYGFDEAQYLASLDRVPRLNRAAVDQGMAFLLRLADMLSRLGYSNATLARLLAERDRLTTSLHEEKERLKRAQEIAHLGSWEFDPLSNALTWSDEVYRIFGLDAQHAVATYEAFLERVHPDDRAAVDSAYVDSVRENRDSYDIEHRVVNASTGETRFVHERCHHIRDCSGRIIRSVGMVHDVTEQKRAEIELNESRLKYQSLIETTGDFIWEMDSRGRYTYCSPQMERLWGLKPEEMIGKTPFDIMPEESKARAMQVFAGQMQSPQPFSGLETAAYNSQGRLIHVETGGVPFFDKIGALAGFRGITRDITERKRAEEALRELNTQLEQRVQDRTAALKKTTEALETERRRFMDVLDLLPAYVILLSPDYQVPFANRFFEERFGKSQGRRCFEYLFNRAEPCEVCESFKPLRDHRPAKWEWTGPDGRIYDISDFPFTDTDGSTMILEMGIDITDRRRAEAELEKHRHHLEDLVRERTSQLSAANLLLQSEIAERKEAEQALQESEERFRLAIQHSKLMAWQCDGDLRFTWVYNSHFGVSGNELLGKTPGDLGLEEGMQDFIGHVTEVLAQGAGTRKSIKHIHGDGREQYFDQQVEAVRDSQGNIVGLIGISLDVTERVLAEQRLHKSEESFRLMIGHSADPMLLVDEAGTIECISRKAANQLGYSEADLVGSNVERFLDWSGKLDLTMRLDDFRRHGPLPARGVLRIRMSDGSWCWIDVQASFVNYGQKPEKYLLRFELIDTEVKNQ